MMTVTTAQLTDSMQTLIDARLDTIDRMLLGRVPRADRLAIVREVEGQIYDLLAERGSDEPDRDDVLAVLARLDPPEAYLPEEGPGGPAVLRAPSPARVARPAAKPDVSGVARASGILGIAALTIFFLTPAIFLGTELLGSEILLYVGVFGAAALSFVTGLVGIALALFARLRGAWAIVGLVTGVLAVLFSGIGSIGLLLLF
jgi:hypothetical protein